MNSLQTRKFWYHFKGANTPPASGSPDSGPFVQAVAFNGTVAPNLGNLDLSLGAAAAADSASVYMNDELPFLISDLIRVEFLVQVDATIDAEATIAFGVCSAFNVNPDSMTECVLFKMQGNSKILCESDDGTNDNRDIATGFDIRSDAWQRFVIDFSVGNTTVSAGASKGGLSDVQFFAGNKNYNALRRVASGQRFDVSNYIGGLQLFAIASKTNANAVANVLKIREICVEAKIS